MSNKRLVNRGKRPLRDVSGRKILTFRWILYVQEWTSAKSREKRPSLMPEEPNRGRTKVHKYDFMLSDLSTFCSVLFSSLILIVFSLS